MTMRKTARKLAALTLTICALWLCGVCASADSTDSDDFDASNLSGVSNASNVSGVSNASNASNVSGVSNAYRDSNASAAGKVQTVIKETPKGDYSGKTVILHSNDVMGAVEGYPRMAWLKHEFERLGAETILADAGNFSVGAIYLDSEGSVAAELMNLTGYNAACLGRYELNYGYDATQRNMRRAAFPFLCANAEVDGEIICAPNYTYTTRSGLTIGFFGLLTPITPKNFDLVESHEIEIDMRRDIYKRVQGQIDALRQEGVAIPGADLVIALSCVGSESAHNATGYSSLDIFSKAQGLDMILDGKTGKPITAGPNGEMVQSCGEKFAHIGVVVVDDATKSIEDHYLIATETLESDETVLKRVETLQNRYKMEYGAVFARTETALNGEQAPGNRTEETNLGDMVADALLWTARRELKHPLTDEAHTIAIINGASIRAGIFEGNITRNHIVSVFPFADTFSLVYVTGAELLEILEASTFCLPEEPSNSYPQTAGVSFTLDERVPYDEGELYPDSRFRRPASVRRVRIDSIRGQPFDPEALYAVATNSYCAGGSGTFHLLGAADERYDSTTSIEEAITNYIRLGLGGVVTHAAYGQPRGDHTILA